jgi:hypothetical protein
MFNGHQQLYKRGLLCYAPHKTKQIVMKRVSLVTSIVVILAGSAFCWYAADHKIVSDPSTKSSNATTTGLPTSTVFKTYYDPNLGFEFQYPANVIVNDVPYNPPAPLPPPAQRTRLADVYLSCETDPAANECIRQYNIDFLVKTSATTSFEISDYYARDMKFVVASREKITLGGAIAAIREVDTFTYPSGTVRQDVHISFYDDGELFGFNYPMEDSQSKIVQTFISSFKLMKTRKKPPLK